MTTVKELQSPLGLKIIRRFFAFVGFCFLLFAAAMPGGMYQDNLPWEHVRNVMIILACISALNFVVYFGISKFQKHGLYLALLVSVGMSLTTVYNLLFISGGVFYFQLVVLLMFLASTIYLVRPKTRAWFSKKDIGLGDGFKGEP